MQFDFNEEQNKMHEIASQASQLEVHNNVIEIERRDKEIASQALTDKVSLTTEQEKDEMQCDEEEEERKQLLKEAIDESGGKLSPALIRLLRNIQGIEIFLILFNFISYNLSYINFYCLGSLGKQMRGMRRLNGTVRSIHNDTTNTVKQNETIISLLKNQSTTNEKMTSYITSKNPDVGKFFPLPDGATLERFLDESDPELYKKKMKEFYDLLMTCITDKQNLFGSALMRTLFKDSFVLSHTWPSKQR